MLRVTQPSREQLERKRHRALTHTLAKSQEAQAQRKIKDELLSDCSCWKGWEMPRGRRGFQVGLDQTRVDAVSPNAGNVVPTARDCEYPGILRV